MVDASLFGTDVLLFLGIGLLGGAHCIGMCGPLVTIYADRMTHPTQADGGGRQRDRPHLTVHQVRQHALFNVGRAASYTLIGALMGALGGAVFVGLGGITGAVDTLRGVIGIGIGAAIVVMGGHYVAGRPSIGLHVPGTQRVTGALTAWVDALVTGPGIVGLGAIHGLLPCPILYPAYLYAFATGSPTAGAIALAALGLGTIPTVFAYGTVLNSVDAAHRRRLHRLLGVAFVVLGYVLFAHGLMSIGVHIPHPKLPFWNPIETGGGGHAH